MSCFAKEVIERDLGLDIAVEEGVDRIAAGALKVGTSVSLADGTVFDLDGGSHTNLILSGLGTLRNGTVDGLTIRVEASADDGLCIDGSVSLEGGTRVDFGAAADDPVPTGRHIVATYSGMPPQVEGWRAVNLGGKNLSAMFATSDGVVVATVKQSGFCLIFK
jgi:hypothetical protein